VKAGHEIAGHRADVGMHADRLTIKVFVDDRQQASEVYKKLIELGLLKRTGEFHFK